MISFESSFFSELVIFICWLSSIYNRTGDIL